MRDFWEEIGVPVVVGLIGLVVMGLAVTGLGFLVGDSPCEKACRREASIQHHQQEIDRLSKEDK